MRDTIIKVPINIAIATGCFVASFFYQILFMYSAISSYDEGLILFGARRVMDGDLIHRDFYSNYGPGQFYTLAALFEVFSKSVLVARLWHAAVLSSIAAIVFLIVRRATRSSLSSLATSAISTIWLGSFGSYGYPVFPALAASLAGFHFLQVGITARASAGALFGAGICVGVAFLFRYDIGAATASLMAALVGLHAALPPASLRRRIRAMLYRVWPFTMGFALVAAPLIAAMIVRHAFGDLILDVVTYPAQYYVPTRSLPFPAMQQVAGELWLGAVYLPLILTALAAVALGLDRRSRPKTHPFGARRWTQVSLIALTLLYFAKGYVRVSPLQMSMAIVVSLVLAGIVTADLFTQHAAHRTVSATILAVVLAATLVASGQNAVTAANNLHDMFADGPPGAEQSLQGSCRAVTGLAHFACFSTSEDRMNTIGFLKAHTRPNDRIYVGTGRHDRIVANDVALYFFAGLRSATKWEQFDPGLQNSAPIQQEMIGELGQDPPRYVVLETQWDDSDEPNTSRESSGVTLLDRYISDHYGTVATFGTISVLKLRAQP